MPRNRIIYANEGLFAGPAPASSYSFMSEYGAFANSGAYNLIFPFHRVQEVNYSIDPQYENLQGLGKRGTVYRPQISPPQANINFEYLQFGILNELRLGLYANYTIEYGERSGEAYFPDNYNVFVLSGFMGTDLEGVEGNNGYWPRKYRDNRNLYLATAVEGADLNYTTLYEEQHPVANQLKIAGFGNCYITQYNVHGQVGDFPRARVSYLSENVKFYASGSGIQSPAVDSKSGLLVPDRIVSLPNFQSGTYAVSAIRPGDITVDIISRPSFTGINAIYGSGYDRGDYDTSSYLENIGIKISDAKIQSYDLTIPLARKNLNSIGYKLPLNRVLEFPLFVSCSVEAILGDSQTGDFTQFMRANDDYDISIKLRLPSSAPKTGIGIQYELKRAKLEEIRYENKIGDVFKTARMDFSCELDPDDLSKGMFISGKDPTKIVDRMEGFLLLESSTDEDVSYLLLEDGGRIRLQYAEAPRY